MRDDLYIRLSKRVERRLSGPPKWATIHALVFTAFAVPMGLLTAVEFPRVGLFAFLAYGTIVGWSLLLFLHAGYVFLHSGALKRRREQVIQQEVLDAGDSFDLSEDDMIALHQRLDDVVRSQSQAHIRLMANVAVNLVVWPGILAVSVAAVMFFGLLRGDYAELLGHAALAVTVVGTLAAAAVLPFHALRSPTVNDEVDNLRAVYGYKRKRGASRHAVAAERLSIGDDGELISESIDDTDERDYERAD